MTTEEREEAARQSWLNARSGRMDAETCMRALQAELAAAQARVTQQEQMIARAYERENQALEFYRAAEKENTVEAKARASARAVAEQVTVLREKAAEAQALLERAQQKAALANTALAAYVGEQEG